MQANFDALSYSEEAARCCHLNMTYFKRSKRSDKGHHRTRPRFWYGEYLCKITKRYRQFLRSYSVHMAAWPWPWPSLNGQKSHIKVNVELVREFYVENIHVKLQHDTGNLQRVIAFTRFRTSPAHMHAHPGNDNTLKLKGLRDKKVSLWHTTLFKNNCQGGLIIIIINNKSFIYWWQPFHLTMIFKGGPIVREGQLSR